MSESFIKIPSFLGFHPDISPLELRVLMALIFWSGINTQEAGHVKYGAEKLGKQIGIGRESCRKALYKLANLKLISINHRGNLTNESYGISNDIELTLDAGIKFLRNGGSAEAGNLPLNKAGNLHLNDAGTPSDLPLNCAGDLHLKTPDLPLNWADLHLNDAGHIDDRFKININLNKIQRTHARTHNETDDDTSVRSKPNGGQAAESSAGNERGGAAAAKSEDRILLGAMRARFTDIFDDLSVSRAENTYILRKKGKFALIEDVRLKEVADWMKSEGIDARILDVNTRVMGEVLIQEVA